MASSRATRAKTLKFFDDEVDKSQKMFGAVADKNIPLISKKAGKMASEAGDTEVGFKAGRVANFLGAGKKGTIKAMDVGTKTSRAVKDTASDASETISKFAGEHGGKVAAGVAAGLGALGLAKLLRRKKKENIEAIEQNI